MNTGATFVGFLVSAGVGFAVGYAAGTNVLSPSKDKASGKRAAAAASSANEETFRVPLGTSPQKGPSDALVTIVEFSDFECPFCGRVVATLGQLEQVYGQDVRVVFKHFPLPIHQNAPLAAEITIAAMDQGRFWEMHDKLFASQEALDRDSLMRYASEIGLDVGRIEALLESGRGRKQIADDQALGDRLGVTGTPTFFINGVKLSGMQPLPNFQKIVDQELAKARKLVESGFPRSSVYGEVLRKARETPQASPAQARPPPPVTRQNVALVEGSPARGAKEPLVTIVEWSDFECPFCSRVNPTLDQVIKEYPDKVQVQFRHQPLTFHKRALASAKAAMAAHLQGKFWAYHDKLFGNQNALEDADLERYAEELGLNVARFKTDVKSPKVEALVQKDIDDGAKYGARGTPTLFIDGIPIRGAQPLASFKTAIDHDLALADRLLSEGVKRKEIYSTILRNEAGKPVELPSPLEKAENSAL